MYMALLSENKMQPFLEKGKNAKYPDTSIYISDLQLICAKGIFYILVSPNLIGELIGELRI